MDVSSFVAKWSRSSAAEHSNSQSFLNDLCDLLGVERPSPATGDPKLDHYVFEKPVLLAKEDNASVGHVDLFKEGHFVLEAKQGSNIGTKRLGTARRDTPAWNIAMKDAYGQALGYAKTLDDPPPFIVTIDIGHCFDLYAAFDGSWDHRAFPNAKTNRIFLKTLLDEEAGPKHLATLRAVFTDPLSLDPSHIAVKVTREVAAHLAELARVLEEAGHPPERIAKFLMRCIFTMFAEDVGLLPNGLFAKLIKEHWLPNPPAFPGGVRSLWKTMNEGGDYFVGKLLQFNGGLFKDPDALPLTADQLLRLQEAAECQWAEVEPAIFGTLLERALDPHERHALGAHYTPRAYVERLVRPTIEEPMRAEWDVVRAEVRQLVEAGKEEQAKKAVRAFYDKLTHTRVLDPACGTGNFLYVTLDLFKRLEAEVVALLGELEESQVLGEAAGYGVTPQQFLGIEVKPWAKEIAELVLWIGYLQWHFRTHGRVNPPEPVLRDYGNIELRDAVLAYDREELVRDEAGRPASRWDGRTHKKSPVTGEDVPDEGARVPVYRYIDPSQAEWPKADFIIGNPPYLGKLKIHAALGDGYVSALRVAYEGEVPEASDYVMYWWHRAAAEVASGRARRFGLVTTNSITQAFNRQVVANALAGPVRLVYALPDHPWVDDGAAIRVAMTVGTSEPDARCVRATETDLADEEDDAPRVRVREQPVSRLNPDLSYGVDVSKAGRLTAAQGLSHVGVGLHGKGFALSADQGESLLRAAKQARIPHPDKYIRPTLNGRDVAQHVRGGYFVDLYGLSEAEARTLGPIYQWVLERVKPEREQNRREGRRKKWWLFGENAPNMRSAVAGLTRFIGTTLSARHRVFQFISADVLPDQTIVVVALDDAYALGVLSSRIHLCWAAAAGGRLGVGNDLRYLKATCFDAFPFPECDADKQARVRELGESLDAHRKRQQRLFPDLTVTGMYNVLAKLRAGEALTSADKAIHEHGLVSVLRELHDEVDEAVLRAYGWPRDLSDEQVLERLVALNAQRIAEEGRGEVHWLRPEFQNPDGTRRATQVALVDDEAAPAEVAAPGAAAWPTKLPDRIAAVRAALAVGASLTTVEVAKKFKRARRADVEEVLQTLAALGLAVSFTTSGARRWRAAGRRAA